MGVSHSTARWLAPTSFIFDFALQQVGIFSSPNMVDIHKQNMSFWSPQYQFIGGFFGPQQIFQLIWLYRLWKGMSLASATAADVQEMTDYTPAYALGNFCIGTWMFFWNSNDLKTSNVFVIINSCVQLAYLATALKPMNTNSTNSILTHIVAKTFAGIGVLDLLHNTSAAYYKDAAPSTLIKVATGLGFAGLAFVSDWIFGGCLVYDLIALSVGQGGDWGRLLGAYAVGTGAIVGMKNWFSPPYVSIKPVAADYGRVSEEDV